MRTGEQESLIKVMEKSGEAETERKRKTERDADN